MAFNDELRAKVASLTGETPPVPLPLPTISLPSSSTALHNLPKLKKEPVSTSMMTPTPSPSSSDGASTSHDIELLGEGCRNLVYEVLLSKCKDFRQRVYKDSLPEYGVWTNECGNQFLRFPLSEVIT